MEARAAASASPCLFCCVVTSCYSSKVATARQRCGRQSNFGASFAHVSQLPKHWLRQSQPQRPRLLALERGSTTDLQPWSVRCVNKFIMWIVPQAYLDETFFRSPPHGLGNSPSTAGPNSSYFAKIFLRRVPCDFSEQTLVQVLCTFELLLDSATFWFLSRLLESLHVTRPTSVNRVARKRQHKSYLVATSTWSSRCVYVRTVYTVAKFHRDPLFSKWGLIFLWNGDRMGTLASRKGIQKAHSCKTSLFVEIKP